MTTSSKRSRMGPRLAEEIAAQIDSMQLPDGAHLRTTELAARLGVSRWPVEQALKALLAAGRVTHQPNRGYFVAGTADPRNLRPCMIRSIRPISPLPPCW